MTDDDKFLIKIDGADYEASPGELIIEACDKAGVHVPRFCYHPRMKPVGMCRMCLVEVSGPRGMSLQPSCYMPVQPDMEIVTESDKVKKAQDGVLEFLLINHPLDCPVCDKGGECPLQDQTLTYGPGESRFVEAKRHWAKPIALSELILLDRERCIQCARCTRFAEEVAGDPMIDFMARGDSTEVNIFDDNKFTSYFSGNTVQICPVGALTATPYRFASRPWDLEQAESTCVGCATGCRMVIQSSQDKLIRYLGIDSDPVNQSWLCDKGRFGYLANYAESRVVTPQVDHQEVSWKVAVDHVARAIKEALATTGPESIGIIGGSRLPNEDAYAWSKLARSVFGTNNVDAQLGDGLDPEVIVGLPKATIDETCASPLVVLVGPDIKEESPILFLRLKGAIDRGTTRVLEISPNPTSMTKYSAMSLFHRPGEAHLVVNSLVTPGPTKAGSGAGLPVGGVELADIDRARALIEDSPGVVFVLGRASMADSAQIVTQCASKVRENLPGARFLTVVRRANTHGALDCGLSPNLLPGRMTIDDARGYYEGHWGQVAQGPGMSTGEMLARAAAGSMAVLILLGADPVSDFPSRSLAKKALESGALVVSVTSHLDESAKLAGVILPTTTFGEKGGTTTNFEGRVSSLSRKVTGPGQAFDDWTVAVLLAKELGGDLGFSSQQDISEEMERVVPLYSNLKPHIWTSLAQSDGVVIPLYGDRVVPRWFDPIATPGIASLVHHPLRPGTGVDKESDPVRGESLPQVPARVEFSEVSRELSIPTLDAYSLRLMAPKVLYDRGVLTEPLSGVERPGSVLRVNHYDLDRIGAMSGDRVRVVSSAGAHEAQVEVDDSISKGTALVAFNVPRSEGQVLAGDLIGYGELVTDVRLEAL